MGIVFKLKPPQGIVHTAGGQVSFGLLGAGGLASHYYKLDVKFGMFGVLTTAFF